MIMLQLAKYAGASKLILSEPVEEKREQALKLGATKTINPLEENVQEVFNEYCKNVDVVIECVGNIKTQEQAVQFAGSGYSYAVWIGCSGRKFPNLSGRSF